MKSLNGRVINENVSRNQFTPVSIGSAKDVPNEIGNWCQPIIRPMNVARTRAATDPIATFREVFTVLDPGCEMSAMLTRSRTNATATTARLTTSPRPGES